MLSLTKPELAPWPMQLDASTHTVSEITANTSRVTDEKLSPLSELLKIHQEELDSHDKHITEAKQRISELEDVTDLVGRKMKALEKMVYELSERSGEQGPT